MIAPPRPLQATLKGLSRWAASVRSPAHPATTADGADGADPSTGTERYVNNIFTYLAVFRFMSFAMGIGLGFALPRAKEADLATILLLVSTGVYNATRVRWRWSVTSRLQAVRWLALAIETTMIVALLLETGGLESPFLVFSLVPILTASLLMDLPKAMTTAAALAMPITGAYLAGSLGFGGFPGLLTGNFLSLALIYSVVCIFVAFLPFLANLNWQARIRYELVASERGRLRREVHDNVAQTLAFLKLKMSRTQERLGNRNVVLTGADVDDIAGAVERAYISVRDYLDDRQDPVGGAPLSASLQAASQRWSRETGIPVTRRATGVEGDLPPGVKIQLLQIAREALANSAKHAYPRRVWIETAHTGAGVSITIRDDGRGFSPDQPMGHGMRIITERAGLIGASIHVQSAVGRGTEVVVNYPLRGE